MTAPPAWTPASRPGLIPLHPLSFGTILGRSFTALRQNPRVLLGFALVIQTVAYIIVVLAVAGVAFASLSRLDTLQSGSEDFDAVLAGSLALVAITGIVLGLAAGALSTIVQGIVVTEVAHAAVAERLNLKALWAQLRPVIWRLIGYTLLLTLVIVVALGVVVLAVVALAVVAPPLAIVVGLLAFFAALPLYLWLGVKILLAPAAIVLEHARITEAIARSWRLTRGRFWPTLGVVVIIQVGFSIIAQVITVPFSLFGPGLASIIAPTGEESVSALIGVVGALVFTQILTLIVSSVALVVQATASSLIYIDCRMRHEGLDLDLLEYVEQRDAGATTLPDPYRVHVGRTIAPRSPLPSFAPGFPPYPGAPYPPAAGAPPYLPQPGVPPYPPVYGTSPAPTPQAGSPYPPPYPAAQYPLPYPAAPPSSANPAASPAAPDPAAPSDPSPWIAPGAADQGAADAGPSDSSH